MTELKHSLRDRPKRSLPSKNEEVSISHTKPSKAKSLPFKKQSAAATKLINLEAKLLIRLINSMNRDYCESKKRESKVRENDCQVINKKDEFKCNSLMKRDQGIANNKEQSASKKRQSKKIVHTNTEKTSNIIKRDNNVLSSISRQSREKLNTPFRQSNLKSFGMYHSRQPIRQCTYHIAIAFNIFLSKRVHSGTGKYQGSLDPTFPARMLKINANNQHLQ